MFLVIVNNGHCTNPTVRQLKNQLSCSQVSADVVRHLTVIQQSVLVVTMSGIANNLIKALKGRYVQR